MNVLLGLQSTILWTNPSDTSSVFFMCWLGICVICFFSVLSVSTVGVRHESWEHEAVEKSKTVAMMRMSSRKH